MDKRHINAWVRRAKPASMTAVGTASTASRRSVRASATCAGEVDRRCGYILREKMAAETVT